MGCKTLPTLHVILFEVKSVLLESHESDWFSYCCLFTDTRRERARRSFFFIHSIQIHKTVDFGLQSLRLSKKTTIILLHLAHSIRSQKTWAGTPIAKYLVSKQETRYLKPETMGTNLKTFFLSCVHCCSQISLTTFI